MHSPDIQFDPKADEYHPRLADRFRQASQIIALLVAVLGLVVLGGWAFNVPALTYIRPAFQSMKVNTALCFLLLGAGLWLAQDDEQQRRRRILGLVVVVIAGASLVEYAFHVSLGIDQLLFRDTRTPSLSAYPGRMAIATAICFLFLGLAVTFLGTKKAIALQRGLVGACFAVSLVALCGYLYGVEPLYSITSLSTVAVHTAAGFLAACLAYFLARPDEGIVSIAVSDSNSGFLLRTLVPAIVGVPILIGWLRLAGQRAHLYDTPFGVGLMVLGSIGCLTAITLLVVRSMHRLEYEQSRAEEAVRESEQRFRLVADTAPVLIWMSGTDKLCTYFNKPWLDFTGRSMEAELGSGWAQDVHPDDRQQCLDTYQQSFDRREKFRTEYRLRRHDGEYRWVLDIGVPRFNRDRSFAGYIGIAIDATDDKLAEEARFRHVAVIESSDDAIASGTLDGIIVSWNTGAQRIYGYTEAEAIGKPINMLVPPELPNEEDKILERLRAGAHIEHFETVRVSKTGKRINVSLTISPIKDSRGKIVGISGIARDITERKRAEEALRESEERFRNVFRDAGVGMVVVSPEGHFLAANNAFCDCLGYTEEELLEKTVEGVAFPEDWPAFSQKLRETLKEGRGFQWFETRCLHKSGRIVYTQSSASVIRSREGDPQYLVGQVLDITERKRAEESLREVNRALEEKTVLLQSREELLKVFVKSVPVAVAMLDRDLRYLQVSDRWCSDNGVQASDLLGRLRYEVGPEMPERWKEVNRRALEGETLRADEDRWESGGITRWARWEVRPWRNADGAVGGILVLAEDITRRKQMEEELAGMSRKLVEAQEQERARIARELHDDIGQRLAMLTIDLDQVQQNWPDLPTEVFRRMLELRKQTKQISAGVQSLSHDLHSSQLEHLGVVTGIKSWCREFGERQGMQIDYGHDVRSTLPNEVGLCLFRVLQEALHNAAKHSGVKRIEVQLREESGEIHLSVRDLGRGFDIEAARQGRGLGLTSMQERVRLVSGTIAIESKPMGGTTIHVRVPLESNQAQRKAG